MRIKTLKEEVANQIAAGEVIERPASVVKELIENSIDAHARSIQIEIEGGGLNRIKVVDDGHGINHDDLPLAFAPHATSKIQSLDDLYNTISLGFRGEALASIGSVAKASIYTKTADADEASSVTISDGKLTYAPFARKIGTTIEVVDLFYNAPVRKKFLKPMQREFQFIDELVKKISLSHFEIAFSLYHNGRLVFELPKALDNKAKERRIIKVMGKRFVDNAFNVDIKHQGVSLSGWVASANYQRSQSDKLWLYINGRMVKDKLILGALKKAYGNSLYPGRFPACVLYLDINSEDIDVNVHPAKSEVRFVKPKWVHDFVLQSIETILKKYESPIDILPADKKNEKRVNILPSSNFASPSPEWKVINSDFCVYYAKHKSYLVDLNVLNKAYLVQKLTESDLPLKNRPLLVPITKQITNITHFEKMHELLQKYGVEFDFAGSNTVIIRTVPIIFPQLDIALLFAKLENIYLENELKTALIEQNVFDAYQIEAEEKEALEEYMNANFNEDVDWAILFDAKTCKQIFTQDLRITGTANTQ